MLVKFSGVASERTVSKFRKRKRKLLCCVHLVPQKAGCRRLGNFMSQLCNDCLRNVENSVMHMQSSSFANINLFLFAVLVGVAAVIT